MVYENIRKLVSENLNNTVDRCWFGKNYQQIKELEAKGIIYTGKVRDSFPLLDGTRAIVVADSVSAFDVVADRKIPFKGQVLNQTSNHWFEETRDIAPNHFIESPHPNVSIVEQCKPLAIEMIVREYLTGSGWRDYESGKFENKYGIKLPDGLKKNQKLPEPILTPTTKAPRGQHDEAITAQKAAELVGDKDVYNELCSLSLDMFEFGTNEMAKRDCIFVDTKYEFGWSDAEDLLIIDEVNTSDSSRLWRKSTYDAKWQTKEGPEAFDKETLRQWIIQQGRDPNAGPEVPLPPLSDEITLELAVGYVVNFENITGTLPQPISSEATSDIESILLERGLVMPKA
jgi:phosphoribosylaminoimidazole-succinocarboxamide synthase